MSFSSQFLLAGPEAILAGAALLLLVWGAYLGRSTAFTAASIVASSASGGTKPGSPASAADRPKGSGTVVLSQLFSMIL